VITFLLRAFDLLTAWLFRGDEKRIAELRDLFTEQNGPVKR
jgi:hypothetical protein